MSPRYRLVCMALVLGLFCCVGAESPAAPESALRLSREQTVASPEALEWLVTLDGIPIDDATTPTLRVTLSQRNGRTLTASRPLTAATSAAGKDSLRLRVAWLDKAAATATLTLTIGSAEPMLLSETLHLAAGQDLATAVRLRDLPPTLELQRGISLGTIGDSMITTYVLASPAPRPAAPAPSASDQARQAIEAFKAWVRGVQRGDMAQFAAGMDPVAWGRLQAEERQASLQGYQDAFRQALGETIDPERFQAEVVDGPNGAVLKVRYGDKALPDITLRQRQGAWSLAMP